MTSEVVRAAAQETEPGTQLPALPQTETAAVLSMIERAVTDPRVDVAKMERMFDLRDRVNREAAEQAFNVALVACKRTMPHILKNKFNKQTKSRYADLAAVSDIMDPIISGNGFTLNFGTADSHLPNHYRITCDLVHERGFSKQFHADIPIDGAGFKGTANKTATHAFGSTMSYGRRYLKLMIFDVATADDNDGNRSYDDQGFDDRGYDDREIPPPAPRRTDTANAVSRQMQDDIRNGDEPGLHMPNPEEDPLWQELIEGLSECSTVEEAETWRKENWRQSAPLGKKHASFRKAFKERVYLPYVANLPQVPF